MDESTNTINKYTQVPCNLYILKEDAKRMEYEGSEEIGYVSVTNKEDYTIINKHAFQPAVKLNDNSYLVTFIRK